MNKHYTITAYGDLEIKEISKTSPEDVWPLRSIGMVRNNQRSAEALMDYMKACQVYKSVRDVIVNSWEPDWSDSRQWKRFHSIDRGLNKVVDHVSCYCQALPTWRYFPGKKSIQRLERMVDHNDIYLVINGPIA